jgi:hypothetical protein
MWPSLTGLSVEEVIRRHTDSEFTVAFCGFAPGFGYLVGGDPALQVPRRQSPRTKIPAGSVALAGAFSGVYPQASPGGWQIIGTTPEKMWDLSRDPPALFQPGYRVRFADLAKSKATIAAAGTAKASVAPDACPGRRMSWRSKCWLPPCRRCSRISAASARPVRVSRPPAHSTLAPSRPPTASPAILSISPVSRSRSVVSPSRSPAAQCSASPAHPCPILIRDASGRVQTAETYQPISLEPGDVVTLGQAPKGMRSYLALRGGFAVKPVLGSASTDTLAIVGPDPVSAGTVLTIETETKGLMPVSLTESTGLLTSGLRRDGDTRRGHGPAQRLVYRDRHRHRFPGSSGR